MADKKTLEISFEDSGKAQGLTADSQSAQADVAAQAAREKEERDFQRLRNDWLRQEQQDKEDLENFFIESTRRSWEKESEDTARAEAAQREQAASLDSFDDLMRRITSRAERDFAADASFLQSIGYGPNDPAGGPGGLGSDLLNVTESADELTEQIDALTNTTQQSQGGLSAFILALTGGTGQVRGGLAGFTQSIGQTISALVGGPGGAGGAGGGIGSGLAAGGAGGAAAGIGLAGAATLAGGALLAIVSGAVAFDRVVNSLVEQVGGFSGLVVQASVRSRLQELEDRMRLAREAGDEIAALERTRSDINSELRGLVREGVDLLGPILDILSRGFVETPLAAIRSILESLNDGFDYLIDIVDVILPGADGTLRDMLGEMRRGRRDREFDLTRTTIDDIFSGNFLEWDAMMRERRRGIAAGEPPFI